MPVISTFVTYLYVHLCEISQYFLLVFLRMCQSCYPVTGHVAFCVIWITWQIHMVLPQTYTLLTIHHANLEILPNSTHLSCSVMTKLTFCLWLQTLVIVIDLLHCIITLLIKINKWNVYIRLNKSRAFCIKDN